MRKPIVFISYCREDRPAAGKLYDRLVALGADPWLDDKKIKGGQNWKLGISKAIAKSDFFVALISRASVNKRGHVQKEIKEAIDVLDNLPQGRAFIIPCRLEKCELPHTRLTELQWVDFFPDFETGVRHIALSIELKYSSPFSPATEEQSKSRVRLTLTMPSEASIALDELMANVGAESKADVIRRALALLELTHRKGREGYGLTLEPETVDPSRTPIRIISA